MDVSTIAAIASPPGPGQRGVLRLSGPRAAEIARAVCAEFARLDPAERRLARGRFDDGRGTQPLLLLWMPAPRSFTREDVAEFHLPGAPPLLAAAFARLLELGAEAARPGEFTRRAFSSGRIDLTRAAGVLELIQAHGEAESRAARALLFGGLGERVERARDGLTELRALCEASLDFDATDTGHVDPGEIAARASAIDAALAEALAFESARAAPTGLPRVCLVGAPNAGKSALFNLLLGRPAALVSDAAGTTRDALSEATAVEGRPVLLFDTAGLDAPRSAVERVAQEAAQSARATADLLVWVVDAARAAPEALARERAALDPRVPLVVAWNKIDLEPTATPPADLAGPGTRVVGVSARTAAGRTDLLRALHAALASGTGEARTAAVGLGRDLAERHILGLEAARAELDRARAALAEQAPLELVAEHLRGATDALDELSGATTAEDVLDRIFARFCLGK